MINDEFPYRYNAKLAEKIELKWQDNWQKNGTFYAANPKGKLVGFDGKLAGDSKPFFILDMFPYPSGAGLHVGHPLGYIGSDVIGRFQRMQGKNVLHALGFDAFGLPAEQHAMQTGEHPRKNTLNNIENMKSQLKRLGLAHDDRRSFATIDPEYVKWTQWIFLQLFNSYYDETFIKPNGDIGSARPISELIEKYESGQIEIPIPNPPTDLKPSEIDNFKAEYSGKSWAELSRKQQSEVLFLSRLAYISKSPVNWAPGLGTVLANEEVKADGRSERGNFPVYKKELEQWSMRITKFASRLDSGLDDIDWPEKVKAMQHNWIGASTGASISFEVVDSKNSDQSIGEIEVYTTRPDTLFGISFFAVAPEHSILEKIPAKQKTEISKYQAQTSNKSAVEKMSGEKTGVFSGLYAINPVNQKKLPIFAADYVLGDYGTGAIMAVPGGDERDFEFAKKYDLPITYTVKPANGLEEFEGKRAFTGSGKIINSASNEIDLNGLDIETAKSKMNTWLVEQGIGEATKNYRLRDWLFSRQRYWGEPFPIVYDDQGVAYAVPENQLPVDLPDTPDYKPRVFDPDDQDSAPEPPLARNEEWLNVELDLGDGNKIYRREANTMPNWAGSCWYYLRYLGNDENTELIDSEIDAYWMGPNRTENINHAGGADLYIGGVEHAVLHLLYARFWHLCLYDLGYLKSPEPFQKLFNQGYIEAYAFTDERGAYVDANSVVETTPPGDKNPKFEHNGSEVFREYGKMGKSLKNIVTPDDMYRDFGADTLRVYEMSMGPLDISRPWNTRTIVGSERFLQRLWRNIIDESTAAIQITEDQPDLETLKILHKTINDVTIEMQNIRPNTAIAKLTALNNHLTSLAKIPRLVAEPLILMLAPIAPHIAEELWEKIGHSQSLAHYNFPKADPKYLVEDAVECVVQINGKIKGKLDVNPQISEIDLETKVLNDPKIADQIAGKEIRKIILRPPKIVSIVI